MLIIGNPIMKDNDNWEWKETRGWYTVGGKHISLKKLL
jgi:hypothetical protein